MWFVLKLKTIGKWNLENDNQENGKSYGRKCGEKKPDGTM